jgi:hypothetical protein
MERTESRKKSYMRQLENATYSLFIEDTAKYFGKSISVRELKDYQLENAIKHFEKRSLECKSELLRRTGEPKPNFKEENESSNKN